VVVVVFLDPMLLREVKPVPLSDKGEAADDVIVRVCVNEEKQGR